MSVRQSFGFPLSVDVGTDVGRIRDNNEDSYGTAWLEDGSLFVIVADGMGGHEAGEVASSLAVRVVEDVVREDPDADPRDRLYNALLEANQAILEEGTNSGTRGMGTTAICAILKGNQAYIAQVGDSRCYLFRKGHKMWRTTDHTRVQMLVDEGRLTEEQARHHPEAGMLTRALGHARMADGQPLVPQVLDEPLMLDPGDTLLLCTDGLHDLVEDHEIGRVAAGKSGSQSIEDLIQTACDRGGHDNVTIAMVNAGSGVQDFDPNFTAPTAAPRTVNGGDSRDEDYSTFDLGGGSPPPDGHLHAPTVAPEGWEVPEEPLGPPPTPQPTARIVIPKKEEPEKSGSKMGLVVGVVVAVSVLLLALVGCGLGGVVVAYFSVM